MNTPLEAIPIEPFHSEPPLETPRITSAPGGRTEDPQVLRLAGRIHALVGQVLDSEEVTAILESMGITDSIARQDFGEADVAALARRVRPFIGDRPLSETSIRDEVDEPAPYSYENLFTAGVRKLGVYRAFHWGREFSQHHLIGFFFAMPMLVSIIGLLTLRASLWAALINQPPIATAIGLGTVASFIITGGYSQAIGRRGLFYRVQEEHTLTRAVCYYFIWVGLWVVLLCGLIGFLAAVTFQVLPVPLALTAVTYYFFLSLLWLFLAVLYMQGQPLLFTPAIVIGIVVVWWLQHFGLSLVMRQSLAMSLAAILSFCAGHAAFGGNARRGAALVISSLLAMLGMFLAMTFVPRDATGGPSVVQSIIIGIIVVALLALFTVLFLFSWREAHESAEVKSSRLPRTSLLWYKVGPYFLYGALYYLFLFTDRLVAWSAPDRAAVYGGFLLRFQTEYEVGMDWGLVLLIITVGLTESQIHTFARRIRRDEQNCSLTSADELSRQYRRFYFTRMALFVLVTLAAGIALWLGVQAIAHHSTEAAVQAYLRPIPRMVFLLATPGYAFLSWALFNNVFLFALSRPERVLRTLVAGLIVNAVAGYLMTRLWGHPYASAGFLLGSLTLAIMSTLSVMRVLDRLDYYYYSAFL